MRITPISYTIVSYNNIKSKPVFTAHPDFYKYNSIQSCYFRRGTIISSCIEGYSNIENLFCKVFKPNNGIKNMLIIGIGSSQEPFSYLASIKGIIKDRKLNNNVDLYTVDLQSEPKHIDLKLNAFCNLHKNESFPKYAESSFVKDNKDDWLEIKQKKTTSEEFDEYMHQMLSHLKEWKELLQQGYSEENILKILKDREKQINMCWRVNDEIFDFLEKTYNNSQKSKWDSRIQDVIQTYPDNQFDIISANNVLPYIMGTEIPQTVKNIVRVLKPNGYFITDLYENLLHIRQINSSENMKKVNSGIYQKCR